MTVRRIVASIPLCFGWILASGPTTSRADEPTPAAPAVPSVPAPAVSEVAAPLVVTPPPELKLATLADALRTAAFADALFESGDHYRAITEYKRALFTAPAAVDAPTWSLRIGESLRRGAQHEAAGEAFDDTVRSYGTYVAGDAYLGGARAYLATDKHESALARAKSAADWFKDAPDRWRQARFLEGWSLLLSHRDEEAVAAFAAARGADALGLGAGRLVDVFPQLKTLPHKEPVLAGVLGLVPGLGHLYVGDPASALSALVWNGVFIVAIWQAVLTSQWSVAAVLGIFEAMWYGGSVVGAMTGAHRFNRDARLNAIEDLAKLAPMDLLDRPFVETAR